MFDSEHVGKGPFYQVSSKLSNISTLGINRLKSHFEILFVNVTASEIGIPNTGDPESKPPLKQHHSLRQTRTRRVLSVSLTTSVAERTMAPAST